MLLVQIQDSWDISLQIHAKSIKEISYGKFIKNINESLF